MTFVQWPENRFVRHLESVGTRLRARLGLSALAPLVPAALIDTYDTMQLAELLALFGEDHPGMRVLRSHRTAWSAIAYREKPHPWLIISNPWHASTRTRASLMEEVAHIVLEHKPTRLEPCHLTGLPRRTYTPSKEKGNRCTTTRPGGSAVQGASSRA